MTAPVENWNELDLAAWPTWNFPPVEFMVEGLIPRDGLIWLGGRPKRGKSLFALYLACCLAYGRKTVAEHFAINHRPKVLYVCREDSGARLRARIEDMTRGWDGASAKPGAARFIVRPKFDLANPEHMDWLEEVCSQHGTGLVILDTWTALSPNSDPLGAADQTKLAQSLANFVQWFKGATLVLDHTRKNRPEGQALSSADIMGPSQKWQSAEHVLMLADTKTQGRLEVYVESKDVDDGRFFLDVSPIGDQAEKFRYAGSVEAATEARKATGQKNRGAVHELLLAHGKGLTLAEVEAKIPTLSRATLHRHLKKLVAAKQATVDLGVYHGVESEDEEAPF